MMGKAQREKGMRYERETVNRLREAGIAAERVPLSGMGHEAAGGEFAGDIVLPLMGERVRFEAKKKKEAGGFALLYRWIGKHKGVFVAADRKETLVVMRMSDWLALARAAEGRKEMADA